MIISFFAMIGNALLPRSLIIFARQVPNSRGFFKYWSGSVNSRTVIRRRASNLYKIITGTTH